MHNHQFGSLGFGGLAIWGSAYSQDGQAATALPHSDFLGTPPLTVEGPLGPNLLPVVTIHGPGGVADLLNPALGGRFGHAVGGWPEFDGWPAWDVHTGQQVYYEWLERAWKGGLRSMTMLAVNNKSLCSALFRYRAYGCEDMPAVERQIQAAKDFEGWLDDRSGGPGSGWYRIAYSAGQAREIARQGKLAVTLGVEVPALFGCTTRATCDPDSVRSGVRHLHDLGVRHVFPVHNADNAFGGTALYNDVFDLNNVVYNGEWLRIGSCPQNAPDDPRGASNDIEFHMDLRDQLAEKGAAALAALGPFGQVVLPAGAPPPAPPGANCNPRGLQPLGRVLVEALMEHRMLIDVDHTSTATFDDILDIAEATGYGGIVMGHTGLIEASARSQHFTSKTGRHEGNKDAGQIARVRALGGSVNVIVHQDHPAPFHDAGGTEPVVPLGCPASSEAWVQVYLEAVRQSRGAPVGLGSDFNGLAGRPAPRFGAQACGGHQQPNHVRPPRVPTTVQTGEGVSLPPSKTGNRTFDYNEDGLAHVGLLPDFVADLRQLLGGGAGADARLDPLLRSADAYIRAWERASDTEPPTVTCTPAPQQWQAQDVTIDCLAEDVLSGLAVDTPSAFSLSTSVPDGTQTAEAATGSRTVCDKRGNCTRAGPVSGLRVDKRPPELVILSPSAGATFDADAEVLLDVAADDGGGSGLAHTGLTLDAEVVADGATVDALGLAPGAHSLRAVATDAVGNTVQRSAQFSVVATSAGLARALDALLADGLVTPEVHAGLRDKLLASAQAHDRGQHAVEWRVLSAFVEQLRAQSGHGLDASAASRLEQFALDLVARRA